MERTWWCRAVEKGDQNRIDLLCNRALRNDDLGPRFENCLSELYSGTPAGSSDIL
ncbi:hypothetical protein [Salmonella enterica]|uniref:hypothetical protein n=1 Tax=Salmonella enterica TaxID=28901 RepID=UPI00398C7330